MAARPSCSAPLHSGPSAWQQVGSPLTSHWRVEEPTHFPLGGGEPTHFPLERHLPARLPLEEFVGPLPVGAAQTMSFQGSGVPVSWGSSPPPPFMCILGKPLSLRLSGLILNGAATSMAPWLSACALESRPYVRTRVNVS